MPASTPPVAVLDANVLYSQVLSDYFVHAGAERLVVLKWSSAILDEMIRNKKKRATERFADPAHLRPRIEAADRLRDYVLRTYPGEFIEPSLADFASFQHLPMPDPDDRHVVATAVAARATFLCTQNIADFPTSVMTQLGIRRITSDALLTKLVKTNPVEMVRAHQRVIAWTPGTTHRKTLEALRRAQAPTFSAGMEVLLMSLGDLDRSDLAQAHAAALTERDRALTGVRPPSSRPVRASDLAARRRLASGRIDLADQRRRGDG
jgi:predicted nucleic acid-binding protein